MAKQDRLIPLSATILLHLLLLAVLGLSFHMTPTPLESATANQTTPIVTHAVGTDAVQKEIEQFRKEEQQKRAQEEAEKRRLAEDARKAKEARELEEKRIQDLKKEAAEQEKQRRVQEENERKKILAEAEKLKQQREAEEKKLAEVKKQQEVHRKQVEQEQKEQKKKQEEAKKAEVEKQKAEQQQKAQQKAADEKRRLDESRKAAERELEQKMAAEQSRLKGEQSRALEGARNAWASAIADKVRRNWNRPVGSPPDFSCSVEVHQSPSGDVQDVKLSSSCGNSALDNSIVAAVWKASPLPKAPDAAIFDRDIAFVFKP